MSPQRRSRPLILCIDDESAAVELSIRQKMLQTAGYSVLTTTDPQTGLELFRENPVDIVLTEQLAPALPGCFFISAMKMSNPDMPIAIYSADTEVSPEYMRFADAFITKLVSVPELLSTIERLLDGHSAAAA